jgi:zinc finger protein
MNHQQQEEEKDGNDDNNDSSDNQLIPNIDEWHEGYDINDVSIIRDCLCMNCGQSTGTTTLLPTKVPYFREIIIMNLDCSNCYFKNSEINFGGQIQEYGEQITLTITSTNDLNRQIIKSDYASISIPKIFNFEIPPSTQRGTVSTIEGIFRTAANNLEALQPQRLQLNDLENFYRCRCAIKNLRHFVNASNDNNSKSTSDSKTDNNDHNDNNGDDEDVDDDEFINPIFPFDIILNDISGNSYIENFLAPANDPQLQIVKYNRTPQQDMELGLQPSQQAIQDGTIDNANPQHKNIVNATHNKLIQNIHVDDSNSITGNHQPQINTNIIDIVPSSMHFNSINASNPVTSTNYAAQSQKSQDNNNNKTNIGRNEVMKFTTTCTNCYKETETDMCIVDIPHFKEVIIMSMVCDLCGYRSNEIKGGGGIPKFGCTITLHCTNADDLTREILKSDTAGIAIPEIELQLEEGGLDGVYTSIEGLLIKLRDRLKSTNPFGVGDSNTKHHLSNDGTEFTSQPIHAKYQEFLNKLTLICEGQLLPFTIIISDPLSNSFIGPIPKDALALSLQAEKDGNRSCYDTYIDPNMTIVEYVRTHEQNEILGLNDMKTENYMANDTGTDNDCITATTTTNTASIDYYGTDQMEELPDRIRRIDIRGPDHPHEVGKAPVLNDTTVMGPNSNNYAVPSIGQRGIILQNEQEQPLQQEK